MVPLLVAHTLQRDYLVVLTDTHRGRIYEARRGSNSLLGEVDEAVPRKNRSSGERWGKQQATIARHRENHILHYFKKLAERVETTWADDHYVGIILLGEHVVLEELRTFLPKRLADRVVSETPHAWNGDQPEIQHDVDRVIASIREARQGWALDEIARRLRKGYAVVRGPQEVIGALTNGQIGELVIGPDQGESAWRCSGCGSRFVIEETTCGYCQAPCVRVNLWQQILSAAIRQRIPVQFVPSEPRHVVPSGVAAAPFAGRAPIENL